jgi:flagellar hook protein FlgE
MSLFSSLYVGTSGLQTSSQELSVIGDNIANAGTIGFKGGRVAFEDALAQSLIGGSGQVGIGSRVQAVQRLLTQGSLLSTGVATDLALQGPGFFLVKGIQGGVEGQYYTRAGQFTLDAAGCLSTLDGLRVQGFQADASGRVTSALGDLVLGDASSPPQATSTVRLQANLESDAAPIAEAFDPTRPTETSNYSTSVTVYDSRGKAHQVDVYFRRTDAGTWEWHALADGGGLEGGTAGTAEVVGTGTLTFDGEGKLQSSTGTMTFNPAGAVAPQELTLDFGDPLSEGGTGLAGITSFDATSATTFQSQDGHGAGTLASVSVDSEGNVIGAFTNGQTRILGQVAVADFPAPDQLERVGGNLFNAVPAAGEPTIGIAGQGGRGAVVAGALEASNVDLAQEFVQMISAQRNFQANSKTITTADQLLNELISLKR